MGPLSSGTTFRWIQTELERIVLITPKQKRSAGLYMTHVIIGAKGKISAINDLITLLKDYGGKKGLSLQMFNADFVFGTIHLHSAVLHAERALTNKTNLSDSIAVEILLYASGERQIKQAIEKMGIKNDTEKFVLVIFDSEPNRSAAYLEESAAEILSELKLVRDDSVIDGDIEVLKRFGITDNELQLVPESSWGDLILEKVALVDIIK
jgi:KEOPS complex subunit Cgi121